jgi:hypothetical protein
MMDCGDEGKKDQEQSTVAQATEYKTSGNAYFERKVCNYLILCGIFVRIMKNGGLC